MLKEWNPGAPAEYRSNKPKYKNEHLYYSCVAAEQKKKNERVTHRDILALFASIVRRTKTHIRL